MDAAGLGAGRALRRLGGRADVAAVRRHLPRADIRPGPVRHLRPAHRGLPTIPWARPTRSARAALERIERDWGTAAEPRPRARRASPTTRRFRAWLAHYLRAAASPGAAMALLRMNTEIDVRHVLPAIRVPTLVLHRDRRLASSRRARPLPGRAHPRGQAGRAAGRRPPAFGRRRRRDSSTRSRSSSPACARRPSRPRAGDGAVHRHRRLDRARRRRSATGAGASCSTATTPSCAASSARFRGRELDTAGDGFFATFDGPARAIRCAEAIARRAFGSSGSRSAPGCTPASAR